MLSNRKIVFTKPWKAEICSDEFNEKDHGLDEVIIKNRYSLISPGTELACLSGNESWFKLPSTPGYISVGEVIASGDNVKDIEKGDIVFSYGSHSQYFKINANKQICLKLPDGLKEEYACFTRMVTIAITSLRVSNIELGDFTAVMGMGMVGNFAAQLARLQGGSVIGIDLSIKRLKKAEECGVGLTVPGDKNVLKSKIMDITGNNGVSTLIDATGVPAVIVDSLPLVSKRGEVILLGSPRGEYNTNVTDVFNYIHLNPGLVEFKGAHEWRYPVKPDPFVKHSIERNSKIVFGLIKDNRLKVKPLLTHILKPEQAEKGYNGLKDNKDEFIGVVFDWRK